MNNNGKTSNAVDVPLPKSSYLILTTSPRPIERSAEIAAGASSSKSRRRFVGPQRISKEMLRPAKFC